MRFNFTKKVQTLIISELWQKAGYTCIVCTVYIIGNKAHTEDNCRSKISICFFFVLLKKSVEKINTNDSEGLSKTLAQMFQKPYYRKKMCFLVSVVFLKAEIFKIFQCL